MIASLIVGNCQMIMVCLCLISLLVMQGLGIIRQQI